MNRRLGTGIVILAVAVVSGCGGRGSGPPVPPRVADCEPGRPGGQVTLAVPGHPRTFNPLFAFDSGSHAVSRLLFSSLVRVDWAGRKLEPGLAESWSVGLDQRTWTFKLRENLRWSDGQPLTAEDVVFTWNEVMYRPAYSAFSDEIYRINGRSCSVTNLDERTVRMITPDVFPPFLEVFGTVAILPKHILGPAAREDRLQNSYSLQTRPDRVVCSGPFRLKRVEMGKRILLQKNPEYEAVDRERKPLPYLQELELVLVPNVPAAADLFLGGGCAACESIPHDHLARFEQQSTNGHFKMLDLGSGEREFFWFNQNAGVNAAGKPIVDPAKLKWFRDRKFRQAVSYALDRERIAKDAYSGRADPLDTFIPPETRPWYNPDVQRYPHDPGRARALLAEIGMVDRDGDGVAEDGTGRRVEVIMLTSADNPVRRRVAELIQADLRAVGIQIDSRPVDLMTWRVSVENTYEYECALMRVGGGGLDPASEMSLLKSSEPLHQWFPLQKAPSTDWEARIDSLANAQMRTLDAAERKSALDQVQQVLNEEMPMIPTVAPHLIVAARGDIANLRPSALVLHPVTWNVEEWWLR